MTRLTSDFARKAVGERILIGQIRYLINSKSNGKVNRFSTKDGVVEVGGFEINQMVPAGGKNKKKIDPNIL